VIDHLNIGVSDIAASRAFYERALGPLGYIVLMERPYGVGFGRDGKPDFWISDRRRPRCTLRSPVRTAPPSTRSIARR
jgi:catechol 2,3-dioxygenase-like lactoylglutathione lyase family enzyme